MQLHHLVEIRRSFVGREAQIGRSDLDELAAPSQATQRQGRVSAGCDHQVELWWKVLQQERDPALDVRGIDLVVVVEHKHDVPRHRVELVEQRGQDRLDRWWLGLLKEGERTRADSWDHGLQRGDQVGPERGGLDVARIEREPRRGPFTGRRGCQPFGQQRRLAEAGRGRDERQLRRGAPAQALVKSGTCHQAASRFGDIELGFEQRTCHALRAFRQE